MEKSVTEGIFPGIAGLFSTPGIEQREMLQQARQPVSDPLAVVGGDIRFLQERGRQGIGRAFGQVPEQDRKRQVFQPLVRQLAQQGVDISTADGMVQLAQKLSSLPGFEGEALGLRQRAAQMAQQPSNIFSKVDPAKFTRESLTEFARTKDYSVLVPIDKPVAQQRKTIGKAADSGEQVYQEGDEQFILRNGQKVPYYGSLRKEQGDITVGGTQEKRVLANKTKLAGEIEQSAITAVDQVSRADAINNVLNRSNIFTGVGSNVLLTVGQVANAFGVTVSGTSESEQLDQLLAALTAGQAKNLPGPLSEKELAFLKQAIGTRGVTKETLQATVNRLLEDAYADIIENNLLQEYTSAGKDLNEFNFATTAAKAKKLARLLSKATPEQRRQILGE